MLRIRHDQLKRIPSKQYRILHQDDQWVYIKRIEFPTIGQQMKNFVRAVGRVVRRVVERKQVLAGADEIERRRGICAACEFLIADRCAKCGCFYSKKILLASERCPIGKW